MIKSKFKKRWTTKARILGLGSLLLSAAALVVPLVLAQSAVPLQRGVVIVDSAPSGACTTSQQQVVLTDDRAAVYGCVSGSWALVSNSYVDTSADCDGVSAERVGALCYDTAEEQLQVWSGVSWSVIGGGGGGSPPAGTTGDLQVKSGDVLGSVPDSDWNGTTLTLPELGTSETATTSYDATGSGIFSFKPSGSRIFMAPLTVQQCVDLNQGTEDACDNLHPSVDFDLTGDGLPDIGWADGPVRTLNLYAADFTVGSSPRRSAIRFNTPHVDGWYQVMQADEDTKPYDGSSPDSISWGGLRIRGVADIDNDGTYEVGNYDYPPYGDTLLNYEALAAGDTPTNEKCVDPTLDFDGDGTAGLAEVSGLSFTFWRGYDGQTLSKLLYDPCDRTLVFRSFGYGFTEAQNQKVSVNTSFSSAFGGFDDEMRTTLDPQYIPHLNDPEILTGSWTFEGSGTTDSLIIDGARARLNTLLFLPSDGSGAIVSDKTLSQHDADEDGTIDSGILAQNISNLQGADDGSSGIKIRADIYDYDYNTFERDLNIGGFWEDDGDGTFEADGDDYTRIENGIGPWLQLAPGMMGHLGQWIDRNANTIRDSGELVRMWFADNAGQTSLIIDLNQDDACDVAIIDAGVDANCDGTADSGGSGGAPPSGTDGNVQVKNGTEFAAVAGSDWDGTTLTLPNVDVSGDATPDIGWSATRNVLTLSNTATTFPSPMDFRYTNSVTCLDWNGDENANLCFSDGVSDSGDDSTGLFLFPSTANGTANDRVGVRFYDREGDWLQFQSTQASDSDSIGFGVRTEQDIDRDGTLDITSSDIAFQYTPFSIGDAGTSLVFKLWNDNKTDSTSWRFDLDGGFGCVGAADCVSDMSPASLMRTTAAQTSTATKTFDGTTSIVVDGTDARVETIVRLSSTGAIVPDSDSPGNDYDTDGSVDAGILQQRVDGLASLPYAGSGGIKIRADLYDYQADPFAYLSTGRDLDIGGFWEDDGDGTFEAGGDDYTRIENNIGPWLQLAPGIMGHLGQWVDLDSDTVRDSGEIGRMWFGAIGGSIALLIDTDQDSTCDVAILDAGIDSDCDGTVDVGGGSGDMVRSTYDIDENDTVDFAESVDGDSDATPEILSNGTTVTVVTPITAQDTLTLDEAVRLFLDCAVGIGDTTNCDWEMYNDSGVMALAPTVGNNQTTPLLYLGDDVTSVVIQGELFVDGSLSANDDFTLEADDNGDSTGNHKFTRDDVCVAQILSDGEYDVDCDGTADYGSGGGGSADGASGAVQLSNGAGVFDSDLDADGTPDMLYSASNGLELEGDGTARAIISSDNGVDLDGSANGVRIAGLTNCDTIDTDANGQLSCGTDGGGSGGATYPGLDYVEDYAEFSQAQAINNIVTDWRILGLPSGAGTTAYAGNGEADPETSTTANGGMQYDAGTAAAGGDFTIGVHGSTISTSGSLSPTKLQVFETRMRVINGTVANLRRAAGGLLTGTAGDLTTKTNGAYFWCDPESDLDNDGTADDGAEDDNWWAVTMASATDAAAISAATNTTATDTGVDCDTTTWVRLRITRDDTSGDFAFYIDGTLEATHSTNKPTTLLWAWPVWFELTDTGDGTDMRVDYYYLRRER